MSSKHKSFQFGQYVPNDKVLNKKIPENPRYKHVKPAVDSGKHVVRQINEHKEKQKSCNYRKDEVFKRIKLSTFLKLAFVAGSDFLETENEGETSCDTKDSHQKSSQSSSDRKIANVIMGVGELDLLNDRRKPVPIPPKPTKNLPYLLLDVRDREEFLRCHIITAKNYPSAMLSRSTGYELEEMKSYKRDRFKLIVLYDDDEAIASRVAITLMERGYENIYVLSGGLKLALEIFPKGLTVSVSSIHFPSIPGASPRLQMAESRDHFTFEEIQALQHYFSEAFPTMCIDPLSRSRNSSCSKGGRDATTSKTNESSNLPPLKQRSYSAGAGGDGSCSSQCTDLTPREFELRSCASARNKPHPRKAPWK